MNPFRIQRYRGTILVPDPKGEKAPLNRQWTRKEWGQTIILDPFQIVREQRRTPSFNPLNGLNTEKEKRDDRQP